MVARSSAPQSRLRAPRRTAGGPTSVLALALPLLALATASAPSASAPGADVPVNRAALVKELQLPPISLNLNLTFDPRDLRLPVSQTPEPDLAKVRQQLQITDRAPLHLQAARLLVQLGRDQEAAAEFTAAAKGYPQLIASEPKNAMLQAEYAEALLALQEDEKAATAIENALIADDKLAKAYELSADLHLKHGVVAYGQGLPEWMRSHFAAAEEAAQQAVTLAPDDPHAYVMLFLAKWFPAVFELNKSPRSALQNLPRYEEMSELLKKAASLCPTYPRLRQFAIACKLAPFFAAQMLKGLDTPLWGDLNEEQRRVLASCRTEFVAFGNEVVEYRAAALLFAGVAAFMSDDRQGAYDNLRASADADPKSVSGLEVTVALLTKERKWDKAGEVAEEIRRRKPSGKVNAWIGRILAEQGKLKQAQEAFEAAIGFTDATPMANLGLGVVMLKAGAGPLEALLPLRLAWDSSADLPEVALAWTVVLALIGETAEAKRRAKEALTAWPDSEPIQHVAKELGVTANP